MNTIEIEAYCQYLTYTLIPDLRASGMDATADDFEKCCNIMMGLIKTMSNDHAIDPRKVSVDV